MTDYSAFETVVGLEVHAQLQTASKLFCGDSIAFGAAPNTHISPITLGHPGTLPKMNQNAIAYAVRMGLACNCSIARENWFARKNYFYPDLPKGYQVSQHTTPICAGGTVTINPGTATEKTIRLNRIHLEEDAGKSIHDADDANTCVDYNRAGTPLIEIVTEPDIRSGDEAFACLTVIRRLVRYLGVCDGNMEEGSLRCDANISVRKKGDTTLGTKVEIKNLNSIRNVKRAIEAEAKRLMDLVDSGAAVMQQTRGFDANSGTTFAIRDKEDADDYRYFPEPDLTPFHLDNHFIDSIRQQLPALQPARIKKYTTVYQLSVYDAALLTEEKDFAEFFEAILTHTNQYKAAANWMLGPVKTWLNENNSEITGFPLPTKTVAAMIDLVEKGTLSFSVAASRLFSLALAHPERTPEELATAHQLVQQSDLSAIGPVVDQVLEKLADKVVEYRKGKKGLLALFVGEVMKQTKGKADPKLTNELLLEKLKSTPNI